MRHIPKSLHTSIKLHPKLQPRDSRPIRPPPHHRRLMTTTIPTATTEPSFSPGSDTTALTTSLSTLLHPNGRWQLTPTGNGVERAFKFKTFKKTWAFMTAIASESAVQKHHPEWSNVYNTAFVRWTTHSPPGLSVRDVDMARFCDVQAVLFGELVPEVQEGDEGQDGEGERQAVVGKELADRVAVEGGDCCVPKLSAKA